MCDTKLAPNKAFDNLQGGRVERARSNVNQNSLENEGFFQIFELALGVAADDRLVFCWLQRPTSMIRTVTLAATVRNR
jgi:hypothetical protein